MKMKNLKSLVLICNFMFLIFSPVAYSYAAPEDKQLVGLAKQIMDAKATGDLYPLFNQIKDIYYKDGKYSDFIEFISSLSKKKKSLKPFTDYYSADARYYQLKNLEETQSWDEYFAKGNDYRDQITADAEKAASLTTPKDDLNIYARLLLWKFHKDQEDAFKDSALDSLMLAISEHTQSQTDTGVVKYVADELSSYGQKGKAKELYKIYVDRLVSSDIKDADLKTSALNFLNNGNVDLSQTIYDAYLDRVSKSLSREQMLAALVDTAKAFSYSPADANRDPVYAEKIFEKIEALGGKEAFTEDLMYLRALNLEKSKNFSAAGKNYALFLERFPAAARKDEAGYKLGIISAYIFKDIKAARDDFSKLADAEIVNPQAVSSLYQLGLLSQWEEDSENAKLYYNRLLEKAKDGYADIVAQAKDRLAEITDNKPIEYNLKTFLDASLKNEGGVFDMSKLDLKSNPLQARPGSAVNISSHPYTGENGCFQVDVQYLWSGNLGSAKPSSADASFSTGYAQSGIKEVNLVVVSPSGIVDRDISLIDIN